jgi:hypothetical protein
MAPSSTYFTFSVAGDSRLLFAAYEKPDGELTLGTIAGRVNAALFTASDAPSDDPHHGVLITQEKYSVHRSLKSKDNISVIKLTRELATGEKIDSVVCTPAIKADNSFCPIFTRRYAELRHPSYDVDAAKGEVIRLDNMLPQFTPFVSVFVGPRDREFEYDAPDFQFRQFQFKECSLVVMWAFLCAPPGEQGQDIRAATTAETGPQAATEGECVAMFAECCRRLKLGLVINWSMNQRDTLIKSIVRYSPFFREARADTPEYVTWMDSMRSMNLPQELERQAELIRRETFEEGWWTAPAWFRASEAPSRPGG